MKQGGLGEVDELLSHVERVQVESAVSKERAQTALEGCARWSRRSSRAIPPRPTRPSRRPSSSRSSRPGRCRAPSGRCAATASASSRAGPPTSSPSATSPCPAQPGAPGGDAPALRRDPGSGRRGAARLRRLQRRPVGPRAVPAARLQRHLGRAHRPGARGPAQPRQGAGEAPGRVRQRLPGLRRVLGPQRAARARCAGRRRAGRSRRAGRAGPAGRQEARAQEEARAPKPSPAPAPSQARKAGRKRSRAAGAAP
jgi:hypothetical protein